MALLGDTRNDRCALELAWFCCSGRMGSEAVSRRRTFGGFGSLDVDPPAQEPGCVDAPVAGVFGNRDGDPHRQHDEQGPFTGWPASSTGGGSSREEGRCLGTRAQDLRRIILAPAGYLVATAIGWLIAKAPQWVVFHVAGARSRLRTLSNPAPHSSAPSSWACQRSSRRGRRGQVREGGQADGGGGPPFLVVW